jgi:hypothetical protein
MIKTQQLLLTTSRAKLAEPIGSANSAKKAVTEDMNCFLIYSITGQPGRAAIV